jgi:hypothetical protein
MISCAVEVDAAGGERIAGPKKMFALPRVSSSVPSLRFGYSGLRERQLDRLWHDLALGAPLIAVLIATATWAGPCCPPNEHLRPCAAVLAAELAEPEARSPSRRRMDERVLSRRSSTARHRLSPPCAVIAIEFLDARRLLSAVTILCGS